MINIRRCMKLATFSVDLMNGADNDEDLALYVDLLQTVLNDCLVQLVDREFTFGGKHDYDDVVAFVKGLQMLRKTISDALRLLSFFEGHTVTAETMAEVNNVSGMWISLQRLADRLVISL